MPSRPSELDGAASKLRKTSRAAHLTFCAQLTDSALIDCGSKEAKETQKNLRTKKSTDCPQAPQVAIKSNKTGTLFRFTETNGGLSVCFEQGITKQEDYNYED